MTFRVGQKVVCVDNSTIDRIPYDEPISRWLSAGSVYVIRRVRNRKTPLVWLQGINRRRDEGFKWADSGFYARRFEPLREHKTDISIFTEMLTKTEMDA